jgi:hypothetical protein
MVGLKEASNNTDERIAHENCYMAILEVRRILNIDPRRYYFSGFSGGYNLILNRTGIRQITLEEHEGALRMKGCTGIGLMDHTWGKIGDHLPRKA